MSEYLNGQCNFVVSQPNDIEDWLDSCKFQKQEDHSVWQHPVDLEKTKKGSCMGFSLWAWRRFIELGYETCLVVGERSKNGKAHAWLTLDIDGREMIFDSIQSDGRCYIFNEIKDYYIPFFGVDHNMKNRIYTGYLNNLRKKFDL